VTGKSGHAITCSGGSVDVISWRGRRRVFEVSRFWRVGLAPGSGHAWARPGSAIKTRAWQQSGRTDESDR